MKFNLKNISKLLILQFAILSFAFGQWTNLPGPLGGNVTSINKINNIFFIGTQGSGLWKSTDFYGTNWVQVTNDKISKDMFVTDIEIINGKLFVATTGGLYSSADNGTIWTDLTFGALFANNRYVNKVIAHNNYIFIAISYAGVYRSSDNGSNWTLVNSGFSTQLNFSKLTSSGNTIFAGGWGTGLYRSTNDGTSWTKITTGITGEDVVALDYVGSNTIFTSTYEGVFYSITDGVSWTKSETNVGNYTSANVFVKYNSKIYAGTWGGIATSIDNGKTWQSLVTTNPITSYTDLFIDSSSLWAATFAGVFEFNSNIWYERNGGLNIVPTRAIYNKANLILAATDLNRLFRSTDYGNSWSRVTLPDNYSNSSSNIYKFGSYLYLSSNSGIYRSSNDGLTWEKKSDGLNGNGVNAIHELNNFLFTGTWDGLYRTDSTNLNWSKSGVGIGLPTTNVSISSFASSSNYLFIAYSWGSAVGVYRSSDNGVNWYSFNNGLENNEVRKLLYLNNYLYAITNNGLYRIKDTETYWTKIHSNYFNDFASDEDQLLAFTWNSILISKNFGSDWIENNLNHIFNSISNVSVNHDFIIAGTQNKGIWKINTNEITSILNTPPTITSFTPTSGAVGTTVIINGTGFNIVPLYNIVYFGATKANVTSVTATQLVVTVPIGATYQPITVLNTATGLIGASAKPFIVTFGGNGISTNSFLPKVDFATGGNPWSVAIGDIDGDGKSDLAFINQNINIVSVLRNTSTSSSISTSSFATKVDFATGTNPYSVAIGDIDGDGKSDLAVANQSSHTVSVLRNISTSGSVSFATKVDFATGEFPSSVAIGDIDGDGKSDLAVAHYNGSIVSVLRNRSTSGSILSSSFATKVDFATGSNPREVSIGDIDGDGKSDLAVANQSSHTVSVLRNISTSGSITTSSFATKVDFATGTEPQSVTIGDIDGDGKSDMTVAHYSNTVSVLRNISTSGTVSFATKVDFTAGSNPRSVAIGDLDGDGKSDLAVANSGGGTVSVLRNISTSGSITTSSFATKVDFTIVGTTYSTAIGDIDGDGKSDLAFANYPYQIVSVLRNNNISVPTVAPNLIYPANNAIDLDTTIIFKWRKAEFANRYELNVAGDTTFTPSVLNYISTDTFYTYNRFESKKIYYWKVRSIGVNDTSIWSNTYKFTIINTTLPKKPVAFTGISNWPTEITLNWQSGGGTILKFNIYQRQGAIPFAKIGSVIGNVYQTTITNLKRKSSYDFYVAPVSTDTIETTASDIISVSTKTTNLATQLQTISSEQVDSAIINFNTQLTRSDTLGIKGFYRLKNETTFKVATLFGISPRAITATNNTTWLAKNDIAGKDTVVDFYLELTAPDTIGNSNPISFKLDANKIPSAIATAITGTKVKDLTINYFLSDPENDNLNIKVEYTKNNEANWSVATTTGKLTNITSSQYGGSVNWQTLKDIPDSANVKIRIRVYDNDEGIYWTSGTFKIDNSKIVSITLIDVAETVSGDIKINYLIKDLGNQIVQFSPEYSLNGGNTFKKILGFSGDTSNITPQKYSGTFIWKSRLDIPFTDTNNVVVRFTPRNSYGEGYSDSTNIFTIDNLPPLFSGVQNLIPDSAKVTVNWNIATDKRGPIYYKVYIKKEGDLIFNIADSVQGITSVVVSKLGNFAKYSFNVLSFDALGNCDSNSVVLSAVPGYAPTIKLFTLLPNDTSLVTDTLKFNYNINADNLDTVRYKFEYSKNGGTNWSEARPEALVNEFLNKNINSTFLWLSKKDIPFVENNELLVRITPKGRSGDGNAMLSKKIKVDNAPPQFLGLQNVVADTSGGILILNWFTAQDVNGPIKYFIYVKQNDTNGIYAQVPRITLNTFDTLRDLKNFTKYFIAVRSADSVGNIDLNNNIISASPGKPVNVISLTSPIKASRDTVKFVYSLYSANGDSITLSAEYSLDGGFYWNKVKGLKGKISGITIPNYSDTLLWVSSLDTTNIETREAKFRLIPKGLAAMRGKDSITKKFNLDSQGPKFPGIFFIGSNQKTLAGSIILAWPRANDLNAPVNYLVYISQISNVYNRDSILKQLPQDTLQYIFSGLKGATTYYFNIWAVDSLGNIDKDTVEKSITLSMLGDFTLDGYLTSADLAEFVNGWKIQNTAIADIYPDSGALPYTISKPDGRIDVRDLTLFLYIWNWAYDNNKGGNLISKYNPKNYAQTTNNENAPVKLFGTSAKSFNVNLNKVKNLDVLSLTLSYNQNNLKIDSIKLGAIWSSNAILWKRINHEIGKTEVAVLNFSKDDLSRLNSNEAIEIYYTSKNKDEKIQYAFELYYLKNNSILNGSGKYEFTKTEILPKEFTLSQNYPNPFNGSTLISFALPEASKVKIILYSLLGEVIETIVENEFIAGVHQTQFNTQLATGVYYYKFEAVSLTNPKNKIVDTKKMVLIK